MAKASDINNVYPLENTLSFEPIDNITPSMKAPIIIHNRIGWAEWGLIPSWASYSEFKGKLFNARSETLADKPSFQESWNKKRRCIIPATCFYEWPKHAKGTRGIPPYKVSLNGFQLFGFAGLWSKTEHGVSFTIITRDAIDPIRKIHPRMPVMLTPEIYKAWFGATLSEAAQILTNPETDDFINAKEGNSDLNKVTTSLF